ncbi:MAG: hypothetical protein K8R25_10005 [Methanosarcinales archaeon]|nr:hypothetical protein [Methanosarcinales archaeon]
MKIKMLSIFVVILLVGGFVILNDFKATDSKFSTKDLNVEDLTAEDLPLSGPVVPKAESPIGSITIGPTAHISNVPKTMQVFRVKPSNISISDVHRLADKLGLKGSPGEYNNKIGLVDNAKVIDADTLSGQIDYTDTDKIFKVSENLPPESEAVIIASDFLKKIKMLPGDAYMLQVVTDDMSVRDKNTDELLEYKEVNRQVMFGRKLNGYETIGTGTSIKVYVSDNGYISGFKKSWPELVYLKDMNLKTPEEAIQELKNGKGRTMRRNEPELSNIEINSVKLGYMVPMSGYAQPIYIFEDTSRENGFKSMVQAVR